MENTGVTVTVAAPTRNLVSQAEKPGKFTGVNFKGWQQRVFFWLTTLGLQKFTSEDTLVPADDMPDREKFMIVEAWKQSDFLCKGYILSALEDDLYNVDSAITTSKVASAGVCFFFSIVFGVLLSTTVYPAALHTEQYTTSS